jgi:hypothetical protein
MIKTFAVMFLMALGALAQPAKTTNPKTTQAQAATAPIADEAVQALLGARNRIETEERAAVYPAGRKPGGNEFEANVQRRTHMLANDIIRNFARDIGQHSPSQQEICSGAKLLDAAVRRYLDGKVGPNASPNRKGYVVGMFLWDNPAVGTVYTTIGECVALQPWIDKPAQPPTKK